MSGDILISITAGVQGQRQFELANDSGAKAGMNLPAVGRVRIPVPDRLTQGQFAAILDECYNTIQRLEDELSKLLLIRQGLVNDLLAGQVRGLLQRASEDLPTFGSDAQHVPGTVGGVPYEHRPRLSHASLNTCSSVGATLGARGLGGLFGNTTADNGYQQQLTDDSPEPLPGPDGPGSITRLPLSRGAAQEVDSPNIPT
jgi:hypothetical protein